MNDDQPIDDPVEDVDCWRCPICAETAGSVEAIRRHISERGGDHADHDGWHPEGPIPGLDDDDVVVAVLTPAGADEESTVEPYRRGPTTAASDDDGGFWSLQPAGLEWTDGGSAAAAEFERTLAERLPWTGADVTVVAFECPYCESFRDVSEMAVRGHINGARDECHEAVSGWNPDRDLPGFDAAGRHVAVIRRAGTSDAGDLVATDAVPPGQRVVAPGYGERVTGDGKTLLVNAWIAAQVVTAALDREPFDGVAYAAVTDVSREYIRRTTKKLAEGEIAPIAVRDALDPGPFVALRDRFYRHAERTGDRERPTWSPDSPALAAAVSSDPPLSTLLDGLALPYDDRDLQRLARRRRPPLLESLPAMGAGEADGDLRETVERVIDRLADHEAEAEFLLDETTRAPEDAVTRAEARTKLYMARETREALESALQPPR